MNPSHLEDLCAKVGVPVNKLSAVDIAKITAAPRAQKKTARFKKSVFIVGDRVFKGPYACDDVALMRNIRYTYAVDLLEEALGLDEWQRGSLPWQYLGCSDGGQYYLAATNVGKRKNILFEQASTKIEQNVPVVLRGSAVKMVSDLEGSEQLTDEIKAAALQHLYLRYLLDIGDSGTHNILVREDYKAFGRLIAGIDLEEKRAVKQHERRLAHLFKKPPSKMQVHLYGSQIGNIKSLPTGQLEQSIVARLTGIGIDVERIKQNMVQWERLDQ